MERLKPKSQKITFLRSKIKPTELLIPRELAIHEESIKTLKTWKIFCTFFHYIKKFTEFAYFLNRTLKDCRLHSFTVLTREGALPERSRIFKIFFLTLFYNSSI